MFSRALRKAEREHCQELYLHGVDLIHLELTVFRELVNQSLVNVSLLSKRKRPEISEKIQ